MTEREKMFSGSVYDPFSEGMPEERARAHELCRQYNLLRESDKENRERLLRELIPDCGKNVYLQGPVQVDFGSHIRIGDYSYANFNLVILDENRVTIGSNVFIGPNCSFLTPVHPLCPEDRNVFRNAKTGAQTNLERCEPITVEDNCWLGGGVTVLPGVTIGEGSVIGAGSVVTKSIPPHSLAFGNPCRVIRSVTGVDRLPECRSRKQELTSGEL